VSPQLKTSLGIWAFGPMVTRFVPGGTGLHLDPLGRSVLQWRFIDSVAERIDVAGLREARFRKDAARAYEIVYEALRA
jgi:hypothetical protein